MEFRSGALFKSSEIKLARLTASPVAALKLQPSSSPIRVGAFFRWFPIVSVVLLACSGCTKTPPDPSGREAFESRATAQLQGQVTVRAAVLGDEESSRFFGGRGHASRMV